MLLKQLKKGEYFTKKKIDEPKESEVWVRDDYDRSARTYTVYCFDDVNHIQQLSGETEVYTDFVF